MIGNLVEKNKGNFRAGKGTIAIIVINVIVFIALNFIPDIVDKLLISPDVNKIIERPWTLITVFFSHEILLHIVLNMALLYIFGIELEKITSSKMLVSLYFEQD